MKNALTVAVICLTIAAPATAAPAPAPEVMSAATLRSYCSSKDSGLRRLCSIYILGVTQGISIGSSPDANSKLKCIRDDLTESEMVNAFMSVSSALKIAYPSDMDAPAVSIVGAAMAQKFPCTRNPQ